MDDDFVSSLLCQENEAEVVDEDEQDSYIDLEMEEFTNYSVSEDDEFMHIVLERETCLGFKSDESLVLGDVDWVKTARSNAINWILKTRATFGFRFQTAYLSVTYFDRFLSRRSIDSQKHWAFQLLSVACLSLAAKMEECDVPALSEFPLQDYNFESQVIQRMELLVLTTLEWRMGFITPFPLLPCFITKLCNDCNQSPPTQIWSNTTQLIFLLMKEVNLMNYRPSVIAAAATLVAIDPHLTRKAIELKMGSVSQYRILETENIFVCYDLIQRLYNEKFKTEKSVHSLSASPIRSKAMDMVESSFVGSAATSKRRRLTFNDHRESRGTHDGT